MTQDSPRSMIHRYKPNTKDVRITTTVVAHTSRRVGHVTRVNSLRTSVKNLRARPYQPTTCSGDSLRLSNMTLYRSPIRPRLLRSEMPSIWQARRESNPQPSVLETDALPIELLAFTSLAGTPAPRQARCTPWGPTAHAVPLAPSCTGYFDSLCAVCFRQKRQYLLNSSRSELLRRFFVVL